MRTFNVRLAAILLAIGVCFSVGIYFLHNYQVSQNAHTLLDAAKAAEKEADDAAKKGDADAKEEADKKALRCLQWYVQLAPKDVDALEKLGLTLVERAVTKKSPKTFQSAYAILERTVRQSPDRKKARRELVRMAMAAGRFQDAKEHLQLFLLKDSPKDPDLLEWLGQCQSQLGDYDLALKSFKKAIECGPDHLTAYAQLAALLRQRLSRPKEADQWMLKLIKANPKSAKAHLMRGRYLLAAGRHEFFEEAAAEAAQALKIAPDDVDALGLSAMCAMAKRNYADARRYISRGIQLYPANVAMQTTMADIELIEGHREKAVAVLEQGLKATDRNPELLWKLVNLWIDDKEFDKAKKGIDELRKAAAAQRYQEELVDYLAARIELSQGHWPSARQSLERIRGALISRPPLLCQVHTWIGLCYANVGDRDKAAQSYRAALDIDRNFTPARTALIALLGQMDQVDQGLDEYGRLDPSSVGRGAVAPFLRMLFIKTIRQPPAERNWSAVEKALDAAEKATPGAVEVALLRVQMLLAQGRVREADDLLAKAREKNPKQMDLWGMTAVLLQQKEDWRGVEKLLDESKAVFGDSPQQRLLQAGYLVARYKTNAAERLRKLSEHTEKFSEADCVALWSGLLNAAAQVNDIEFMDRLCKMVAEKRPDNAQVRYMQFRSAMAKRDRDAMVRLLADIHRVAGQSAYWFWGKAVLSQMDADGAKDPRPLWDQALAHLAKARELRGDWPRIPALSAEIHDRQGKRGVAMKEYLEALDMGDREPSTVIRAMQLLAQAQQYAEVEKRLRWLESQGVPLYLPLLQISAEVAMQQQDLDRALKIIRRITPDELKTYQQQLWLGHILDSLAERMKNGGRDREAAPLLRDAETAMRKAIASEPKIAATWVGLVHHYAAAGEMAKARKAIEDAGQSIPAKEAPLAIAQCHDAIGNADAAEKKYDEAAAAFPQDAAVVRAAADFFVRHRKSAKAEPLLRKFVGGDVKAEESNLVWARRQLAAIHAERHTYQDLKKAEELIEQNRAGAQTTVNDLQMLARLYAADPSRAKRVEAIGIFEELIRTQTASDADRLALAQLYLADNNWAKAGALMRSLASDNAKNPAYLAIYIENLLKRGETSDIEDYLDRLKKASENAFPAFALQADWLTAVKRPREAYDLLMQFLDAKDVQPKNRDERVRLVAQKLADLSRRLSAAGQKQLADQCGRQAETLYRAYLEKRSGQELALAAFLAEQGKTDAAMDLVEQAVPRFSPDDLTPVLAAILEHLGLDDKTRLARFDRLAAAALKQHNEPAPLLMVMADSCTRQARYDDAEKFYRRALEKSPDEGVAMNNLAVLLALRGVKLEEAMKLANRALEILGPNGAVFDSRALVHLANRNTDGAIKDIGDALNDRETPVRLFHQAEILDFAGQQASAKTSMFKALHMGLTKDMLQPLEVPAFERLKSIAPKN